MSGEPGGSGSPQGSADSEACMNDKKWSQGLDHLVVCVGGTCWGRQLEVAAGDRMLMGPLGLPATKGGGKM